VQQHYSSQIDYRPLLDRHRSHATKKHSLHWFILIGIIAISSIFFSLTSEQAEATRSKNIKIDLQQEVIPTVVDKQAHETTKVSTTPAQPTPDYHTQTHQVRTGDNLSSIFLKQGLNQKVISKILALGKPATDLRRIHPGDQLIFTLDKNQKLQKLVLQKDPLNSLQIERSNNIFHAQNIQRTPERRIRHVGTTVNDSLFLSAQRADLSDKTTMALAAIFGWDIDFALDIRKGDHFNIMYEELYLDGEKIGDGNIVAAEFINHGRTYKAVRYTTPDGDSNYYTADGKSMRKAFLRTPIPLARISSRFNLKRKHPVLNKIRAHKGVDYAASRGTPIKATGDGKIIHRGRKGGYGNAIIIQHGTRYSTLYAHMSKFRSGLKTGSRVQQGQTIGYVGSTGLATGPHLHYEFRVNNRHRNPLTVKLPAAEPINKKYLSGFKNEAQQLLTQLDLFQRTQLAMQDTP